MRNSRALQVRRLMVVSIASIAERRVCSASKAITDIVIVIYAHNRRDVRQ